MDYNIEHKNSTIDRFCNVSIKTWITKTIIKVEGGETWNDAWQKTYKEIGGESESVSKKGCPMNGAKTLYELGRIRNTTKAFKKLPFTKVRKDYSKNGVYAMLAIEILNENPNKSLKDLWKSVREHYHLKLDEKPAKSNQGGTTVAYKLWHLDLIVLNSEN